MEMSVGVGMELRVEPADPAASGAEASLRLRMLGPLSISRSGVPLALPTSRKVRALIAYLALAPRASTRAHLCELLWDVPNDPRGELRWCLSKARAILDEPGHHRIETPPGSVGLDLTDAWVDAREIGLAMHEGIATMGAERLRALALLFVGDFLEGLELERSPHFNGWLTAQRRRMRACHAAVLEHLVASLPADASDAGDAEAIGHLEAWLQLAPFDRRAHAGLMNALGHSGRVREAEAHLATVTRTFEAEGLDWRPIGAAWRDARPQFAGAPPGTGDPAPPDAVTLFMIPSPPPTHATPAGAPHRASIAVMPFVERPAQRHARGGLAGFMAIDLGRARAAGLRTRSLDETVAAVLDEPAPDEAAPRRGSALTRSREAELLAHWDATASAD